MILSGLFGDPTAQPPNGLPAVQFLKQLYRVPGIKSEFDGVALHPYADEATRLEELIEEVRDVILENHDPGARLYITEMGWGSQNDPNTVSFERGVQGQVTELRQAYEYLIENRQRLNLKATYWFSWKDLPDVCNFCDSVGFFYEGKHLRAEARLARLRRPHRRPGEALAALSRLEVEAAQRHLGVPPQRQRPGPTRPRVEVGDPDRLLRR